MKYDDSKNNALASWCEEIRRRTGWTVRSDCMDGRCKEMWTGNKNFALHSPKSERLGWERSLRASSSFEGVARIHATEQRVDLLQVDLLASGASLFWPRSGRPRATKSRAVVPRHMKSDEGLFESLSRKWKEAWVPRGAGRSRVLSWQVFNNNNNNNNNNHNYNKILKSDWFSTALISALIGQFNRTVRVMPK